MTEFFHILIVSTILCKLQSLYSHHNITRGDVAKAFLDILTNSLFLSCWEFIFSPKAVLAMTSMVKAPEYLKQENKSTKLKFFYFSMVIDNVFYNQTTKSQEITCDTVIWIQDNVQSLLSYRIKIITPCTDASWALGLFCYLNFSAIGFKFYGFYRITRELKKSKMLPHWEVNKAPLTFKSCMLPLS